MSGKSLKYQQQIYQRPRFRLRTVLVTPFVIPIIASTILVGWLSFRNGGQAINDLANQLNKETASRIEDHVLQYLNKSQNTLLLTEAGIKSNNFKLDDFDGLRRYFWQVVHQGGFEAYLAYGNERGEFVGVEYQENGTVQLKIRTLDTGEIRKVYLLDSNGNPQKFLKESEYEPRTRPWYKAAKELGKPTWSEIFTASSSQNTALQISPVRPIYDENRKLLGVLSINIRLSRITNFVHELSISPNGQSFIMERSGNLVASSIIKQPFKVIGKESDRKIERIESAKSDNSVVATTAQNLQTRFSSLDSIKTIQQIKFSLNEEVYFATVTPISDGQGINWLAVVVVPEKDFMERIKANTQTTVLLCLLTLIGATAISVFTSSLISRPIIRLTQASKELATGSLDLRVHTVDIIEIDEIDTLEHSFNTMAGTLQEVFTTLEDKVMERTTELANANAEIIALNEKLKQENLRMATELDVARQIQQMILPKPEELESIVDLDIAGYMEPADEIGGDYYDVLETDGVVTLGIGDVTGHGLESGILMLMTQTAVRTLQEIRETDPVKFLSTLNRTLFKNVQRMDSEKTLTLAIVNYTNGKIVISGQHEEIILVRKNGQIERIDTMSLGFPIALDSEIEQFISHATFDLDLGDGIVLYTDGIPEAININKVQYRVERLCEVISKSWHKSASEIKADIIVDVRRHIGTQKVFDDITLLVLKRI
ncbi:SpoIIE family protein phosphatase [Pseudanabaena sp. ABRG5-3]|uniref:SpoIIE family protein phosphatase n=1 Tax=Pseudanabaena sp. ABRG5-3 TaxID=685565 RepID=UPI000DC711CF|nr:SpoIIE family protein phosphatase [Pseudanabaena sp. ABRG5-3]BBC25880.1 protein serine/threonine phosphatase with Cache sensor [Pseudanabaena sp. ABRG5-3]